MTSREDLIEEAAATIAVAELVASRRTWGDLLEPQKDEYRRLATQVLAVFEQDRTPASDEREARSDLAERARMAANDLWNRGMEVITRWSDGATFTIQDIKRLANAYESGFHCTVQGEPRHDEKCEAEYVAEAPGWTACGCSERQADALSEKAVEAGARAGHEHLRAQRSVDHGTYAPWEELDEDYREYLRGIQRAALRAAAAVREEGQGHG